MDSMDHPPVNDNLSGEALVRQIAEQGLNAPSVDIQTPPPSTLSERAAWLVEQSAKMRAENTPTPVTDPARIEANHQADALAGMITAYEPDDILELTEVVPPEDATEA